VVGDDLKSSQDAVALAEKHENLFAAVGVHPHQTICEDLPIEKCKELAQHPKVVAIGECGLDYSKGEDDETRRAQKELFKQHVALAAELDKPLIIHARASDAYTDLITILTDAKTKHKNLRGDVHFFSGNLDQARALIALSFVISFTAVITFTRDYDEVVKIAPLTSILSETDAPYVAPTSRRGERNDPLAIIEVVEQIAAIRGEDPETVRTFLLENAQRLFAL
jgi:TatD DNase family protein